MKSGIARGILVIVILLFVGSLAFAGDNALGVGTRGAVTDGAIAEGEYQVEQSYGDTTVFLSRTADTLYIACKANTLGWIAVGLGSPRRPTMDRSVIFMGAVENGKTSFSTQIGGGRRHGDLPANDPVRLISYGLKTNGSTAVIEVAVKAGAYIKSGQSVLNVIYATGPTADFYGMHSFTSRGGFGVSLK